MPYKSMTRRGMIPRRVNKNPPKHDSPGETDLPGFETPASQSCLGIKPRGVMGPIFPQNLPGVPYPEEIDSQRYQTPASQSPRGMRPR